MTREREDATVELVRWLVSLDDPEDVLGREERRTVTLTAIVDRARAALAACTPHPAEPEATDGPEVYWSAEYRRFYVLGPGPREARDDRGSLLWQEPEVRFMPSDVVRLAAPQPAVPDAPGMVVDGDVLRDVVMDATPRLLSDDAARHLADAVLAGARRAGMTLLHGPDARPAVPDEEVQS